MVVGAGLISAFYFGGYQIPWLPRPVLEANAGLILTLKLIGIAIFAALICVLFFRRVQSERGKFQDARDREPVMGAALWLLVAAGAAGALLLRPWEIGATGASLVATFAQIFAFIVKVVFFAWLFIWVRWTRPRFRYDQLMHLGWKVLLPLGLANIVVTAVVMALG